MDVALERSIFWWLEGREAHCTFVEAEQLSISKLRIRISKTQDYLVYRGIITSISREANYVPKVIEQVAGVHTEDGPDLGGRDARRFKSEFPAIRTSSIRVRAFTFLGFIGCHVKVLGAK